MARLRAIARLLRENLRAARRGNDWRNQVYERDPLAFLGGTPGSHRDALAWRPVVDWAPIEEADRRYREWVERIEPSHDELAQFTKRELRGDRGGEMRVLASPELLRRVQDDRRTPPVPRRGDAEGCSR